MPRTARVIAVGYPHHITQRGNHGEDVFASDEDRQQYLVWLAENAARYGLDVWAYCLMDNHVHIIAVPHAPGSLAATMRATHIKFSMHVNARHGWRGTLWQGRYYSCVLDERHLWAAARYVEANPVRAGLVGRAEEYVWSSAQPHSGLRRDPVIADGDPLAAGVGDWAGWLREAEDGAATEAVRAATQRGVPCGDEAFQRRMESLLGRGFEVRRPGRPKKRGT
jgi:putative transposase